jgi:hypothetical protein
MENTKNNHDKAFEDFIKDSIDCDNNDDLKQECENLLQTSGYDDEYKSETEKALWYWNEEQLNELKANLYMNQIDRMEMGMNYNQTDIIKNDYRKNK